jgi:alpha-tubulin suppressor-like RCC1 family protein
MNTSVSAGNSNRGLVVVPSRVIRAVALMGVAVALILTSSTGVANAASPGFNLPTPKQLSASGNGYHSCLLLANGGVTCWGRGNYGQLGNGSWVSKSKPTAVSGLTDAKQVSAGPIHTCAVRTAGTIKCWGANGNGQLGNGKTSSSSTPVAVSGITGARQVATGQWHTCALISGGTVKCWGYGQGGQLGNGKAPLSQLTPVTVSGISDATQITAGSQFTCAIVTGGKVKCWGYGFNMSSLVPGFVSGLTGGASQISASLAHGCATLTGGTIKCWGTGGFGQLGNGTTPNNSPAVTVTGITDAKQVAAGGVHTCAVLKTGGVRCWGGSGSGQLGDGQRFYNRYTPVIAKTKTGTNLSGMTQIAAGYIHTCAMVSDASVVCWGAGAYGQIGNSAWLDSFWAETVDYPWIIIG